jgi:phage tail sheath protein FI
MPATLTYPGVYIEEIPSGVHTITGVATSITAFVGYTSRGLDNRAKRIFSFADFERAFGGLAANSELSYAVQQFFANGGTTAYVVRVVHTGDADATKNTTPATLTLQDKVSGGADVLQLIALSAGVSGNDLFADVDYDAVPSSDPKAFNLTITDPSSGVVETFDNVTMDKTKSNFVEAVVNDDDNGSKLILVKALGATPNRPAQTGTVGSDMALDANGKPTAISNTKNLSIKITSDLPSAPAITSVSVSFLAKSDPVPTSVLGVCRLLERKINGAIQAIIPTASVSCVPTDTGKGIRVLASIPKATDAVLTFAAGTPVDADNGDADAALKLSSGAANAAHYWLGTTRNIAAVSAHALGVDGTALPNATDLVGDPGKFSGIYALDKVDLFNLLCIPDATRAKPANPNQPDLVLTDQNAIFSAALTYCKTRRAFLLIDAPPDVKDVDTATDWKSSGLKVHEENAAAYFPRLRLADPLNNFQLRTFAPCGVVAGLYSRIDGARGVWKAPAGTEATLTGVQGVVYKLTDPENGALNPLGLNCFRIFPIYGSVAWGARTLVGSDAEGSEWKYVPVRRMALFLEESLYRGTQWVVFEPNDEPLWAQIRLNIGAFMQSLFRQGAFQGKTPRDAYFVKCDSETTTQDDINRGVVNILVGFAPLKPAEFVIIKIQQLAGQIET